MAWQINFKSSNATQTSTFLNFQPTFSTIPTILNTDLFLYLSSDSRTHIKHTSSSWFLPSQLQPRDKLDVFPQKQLGDLIQIDEVGWIVIPRQILHRILIALIELPNILLIEIPL